MITYAYLYGQFLLQKEKADKKKIIDMVQKWSGLKANGFLQSTPEKGIKRQSSFLKCKLFTCFRWSHFIVGINKSVD